MNTVQMHSILRRLFGYAKHKARTVASLLGMPALAVFPAFYLLVEYTLSGILMVVMNGPIGKSIMGVEYGLPHDPNAC